TSHLAANRLFAQQVFPLFNSARDAQKDFQAGRLTKEQLEQHRVSVEAQLLEVLNHPPLGGWAADSQNLANRFRKYLDFPRINILAMAKSLTEPELKQYK
ncbi:MAG: hypothetical protein ACKPIC_10130, partial [Microcystis panniformis]